MKVQQQLVSKINNKEYYKYVIIIPEEILKEADFKEGDELETETKKGEIKLKKQ